MNKSLLVVSKPLLRNKAIPVASGQPGGTLNRPGKVRAGILLWALGIPIPLILLFLLIRGCM